MTQPDPVLDAPSVDTDALDWTTHHHEIMRRLADEMHEPSGLPMLLDDFELVIEPRHPMRIPLQGLSGLGLPDEERQFPRLDTDDLFNRPPAEPRPYVHVCHRQDIEQIVVNSWVDVRRNRKVYIVAHWDDSVDGRFLIDDPDHAWHTYIQPTRYEAVTHDLTSTAMRRLTLTVRTIGVTPAWDLDAEYRARDKLRTMITDHQWRCYELTGGFIDTSTKSGVAYVFRKNRPTVALVPGDRTQPDSATRPMHVIAVLCLHPIGYYADTWAGCMVPTDDVIAHLMMMRGDEPYFWRKANHHPTHAPESGL